MAPRWLLPLLTQWRAGIVIAGGASVVAYAQEWPLAGSPKLSAAVVGTGALAGFGILRSLLRPRVLADVVARHGALVDERPDWAKARYLGNYLLPPVWAEAVREIAVLLDLVEEARFRRTGVNGAQASITSLRLLAVVLSDSLTASKAPASFRWRDTPEELTIPDADVPYFSRFANAAYGYLFCSAMGLVNDTTAEALSRVATTSLSLADRECMLSCTGHTSETLHFESVAEYYGKIYSPKYYLMVDYTRKAIVLALRGTSGLSDLFTDLDCRLTQVPGSEIMGHSGILRGATAVVDSVFPQLTSLCRAHPKFDLVVTGHSLGAGTAVLATVMLASKRNELGGDEQRNILCYAFGGPPVLGTAPQEQKLDCLIGDNTQFVSVFNGRDIVPRLSLWSANRLLERIERLSGVPIHWTSRLKAVYWNGIDGLTKREREQVVEALDLDSAPSDRETAVPMTNPLAVRLYHPNGKIIHTHRNEPDTCTHYHHHEADSFPHDIVVDIGARFLRDHMPNEYQSAIDQFKTGRREPSADSCS